MALLDEAPRSFAEYRAAGGGRGLEVALEALPFHKIVDWDQAAGRFAYDPTHGEKQPDWTYEP